jgi:hypothetical protein
MCQCEWGVQQSFACCLLQAVFLFVLLFNLEVEANVSLKRSLNFNRQHGVISQKIELFITTIVRTSNPTNINELYSRLGFHFVPHLRFLPLQLLTVFSVFRKV